MLDEAEILSDSGEYSDKTAETIQEFIKLNKIGGLVSFSSKLDTELWDDIRLKLNKFNLSVKILGMNLNNIYFNVIFSTRKEAELKTSVGFRRR